MKQTEQSVINSWLRNWFQQHYEFTVTQRQLRRRAITLQGKVLLDAGCGAGFNSQLLLRAFAPQALYGIDLLPEEVALARKNAPEAQISVGDLSATQFPDAFFDAVFTFGVFHHIPQWPVALQEVRRILKPEGVLVGGEIKQLREIGFTWPKFEHDLKAAGFIVQESQKIYFGYFYSFLCVSPADVASPTV